MFEVSQHERTGKNGCFASVVSSRELYLVIAGISLSPFAASLDYGLGSGSLFRMLPPIFLWIATFSVLVRRRESLGLSAPDIAIAAFVGFSVLSAVYAVWKLNSHGVAQAVGFAVVAGHAVFFWLGRKVGKLRIVLRAFVAAVLVAGIAGLLQRWMLEAGLCTVIAEIPARLENRCLVGGALSYAPQAGRIRLPGTAASPWHWSWLLVAGAACAPALFSDRRRAWRIVGVVTLIVLLACSFLSGQRVALVLVPLVAAAATLVNLRLGARQKALAGGVLLLLGASILAFPPVRATLTDLGGRWRASPPPKFIIDQWRWAVHERPGLLGHGPGAATSAARYFGEIELVESVPAKRLYEVGWIGFSSWYAAVCVLGLALWRRRAALDPAARATSVYVLVLAVMPWWYPVDTEPGNLLFWLFSGMLLQEPRD